MPKERSYNLLKKFGTIEQILQQRPARLQEVAPCQMRFS